MNVHGCTSLSSSQKMLDDMLRVSSIVGTSSKKPSTVVRELTPPADQGTEGLSIAKISFITSLIVLYHERRLRLLDIT